MSLPADLDVHLADVRAVYWPASVELEERIAAIVAVGEVYQVNAYNLEHLLVGLVQFLDRGEVQAGGCRRAPGVHLGRAPQGRRGRGS
jgi:hypothetical protein